MKITHGRVYVHKLGYDTIPQDVRRRYEEKRRATMKPLLDELENLGSRLAPGYASYLLQGLFGVKLKLIDIDRNVLTNREERVIHVT